MFRLPSCGSAGDSSDPKSVLDRCSSSESRHASIRSPSTSSTLLPQRSECYGNQLVRVRLIRVARNAAVKRSYYRACDVAGDMSPIPAGNMDGGQSKEIKTQCFW